MSLNSPFSFLFIRNVEQVSSWYEYMLQEGVLGDTGQLISWNTRVQQVWPLSVLANDVQIDLIFCRVWGEQSASCFDVIYVGHDLKLCSRWCYVFSVNVE